MDQSGFLIGPGTLNNTSMFTVVDGALCITYEEDDEAEEESE